MMFAFLSVLQIHLISSKLIFTRTDTSPFPNPFSPEGNYILHSHMNMNIQYLQLSFVF